jgi:Ser/Thr protein kinase RdoA (MazF antagonist)
VVLHRIARFFIKRKDPEPSGWVGSIPARGVFYSKVVTNSKVYKLELIFYKMGKRLDLRGRKPVENTYRKIYTYGSKIIKVFDSTSNNEQILNEFQVQRDLYKAGISVPKPYGITKVLSDLNPLIEVHGLIMQKVNGTTLREINEFFKYYKFKWKSNKEIRKARKLGFVLGDRHKYNTMVDKTEKVFLIDFGFGCRSPKKLEEAV